MRCLSFILAVSVIGTVNSVAQTSFRYSRAVTGIDHEGWYALNLPPEMFDDLNHSLSDIRIYTVTDGDTLEIPYLLDIQQDITSHEAVAVPMFNKSYRDGSLYLTFEVRAGQKVNHLDLEFYERNYFGWVTLEGSDDRKQWFEIIRDQRIVSVRKGTGDYTFSRLDFPLSDYKFLRAQIKADVLLTLQNASFHHNSVERGNFLDYPLRWNGRVEKKTRQSVIDVILHHYAPVSSVELKVRTSSDYYRPLRIEYVADSFKTDKGWTKRYETLYEGHLTSFRPNIFEFPWKRARELRFVVINGDNHAIEIHDVEATGPVTRLLARLEPRDHFMLYGADDMRSPNYDLAYFQNKIPDEVLTAGLLPAEALVPAEEGKTPLFENKIWLWTIILVTVSGLGVFTIKMMNDKQDVRV